MALLRAIGFNGVSTFEVAPSLHKGDPVAEWDLVPATLRKWASQP
jgi:hypothetical protein